MVITIPEQRFEPSTEAHFAEHVIRCADRITAQLGGTKPVSASEEVEKVA